MCNCSNNDEQSLMAGEELGMTHQYGVSLVNRRVNLFGDVTLEEAQKVINNLLFLDSTGEEEITLLIHSDGGMIDSGFAIYDTLKRLDSKVTGIVVGGAYSMASVILQGCDRRLITSNSFLMLHDAQVTLDGSLANIESRTEWIKDLKERVMKILIKRSKLTKKQLEKLLIVDSYISSEYALELGLVDAILK